MFEKYEGEAIKKTLGIDAFYEWKTLKTKERVKFRKWWHVTEVAKELSLSKHHRPKDNN